MGWRHTMGNDWGGRAKINPENAPKVTGKMVLDYAENHSIQVFRGEFSKIDRSIIKSQQGTWWYLGNDNVWRTFGQTNYLAMCNLKKMVAEKKK